MKKHVLALVSVAALAAPATIAATAVEANAAGPHRFANCTAMNKVFKHGVGRPGAVDRTSGRRVTNFYRHLGWYNANRGSDRDGDGIACEKL